MGDHSHGWVTGEELIAYANTNQIVIVDKEEAECYKDACVYKDEDEHELNMTIAHADFFDEIKI